MNSKLIFADESYHIRNACFEVYKEKGCGFTEPIYHECLAVELSLQNIPHDTHRQIPLTYKGRILQHTFIPDLVCYDKIILELKAISALTNDHRAQVINYLHATGLKLGLLINFGAPGGVQIERIVV